MTEEQKARMPDDPDENAEFEQWMFVENGKIVKVQRRNPRYEKKKERPRTPSSARGQFDE